MGHHDTPGIYRALFSKSLTINLLIEPGSGRIRDANERACAYYGYDHDTITGMTIYEINTMTREEIAAEMEAARREERSYFLFTHRVASGKTRQVEVYSSAIPIGDETLLYSVIFDVEERRVLSVQAREERAQFLALLDTIPHGIYVSDMDTYEILFANRALRRSFDGVAVGRPCYQVFQGKPAVCDFCTNQSIRDTDEPYFWQYHNPLNDRHYHVMDRRILWTDGRWVRFELAVDVTEQKRAEERLTATNRTKDTLLSTIAHDVRNPLATTVSLLRLLDDGDLDPGGDEFRDTVHALRLSTDSTLDLLVNLLDWAQTQSERIEFQPVFLPINETVHETVRSLLPTARAKGVELEEEAPERVWAHADPGMLRIIVRNLVNNAIKFTQPGGWVRVAAESGHAPEYGQPSCTIRVRDSGIGMTRQQIDQLFKPGIRSRRGTAQERGAGIGLQLVDDFVSRHGGTITVESEPERGTTVSVLLPTRTATDESATSTTP